VTAYAAEAPRKELPPPPVGLTHARAGDGERFEAVLPGPVVAGLVVADGGRQVVLLLVSPGGEPDGPRSLYRLDALGEGRLDELRSGLDGGAKALAAADLDGDGAPEVLLGGLGSLDSLGPVSALAAAGGPRQLLRHPGFDLRSLAPSRLRLSGAGEPWLAAAEVGALRLYQPDGRGGVERRAELPLPVRAEREATGLRLRTPPVVPLAPPGGAPPLFAVGPETHGKRRLRTVLVGPGADPLESWSLLPAPEAVEESFYRRVDGRPVLFAIAQSADRIGIFEKKRLRVFPLGADRTRSGRQPLFTLETDTQRWHSSDLHVADLDGDGRDDLVLVQPQGLGGGELLLAAFPGLGGGRFLVKGRRSTLDPAPRRHLYGRDLSGDGLPDLAAIAKGGLALYAGEPQGGRVVARSPGATVPLTDFDAAGREVTVSAGSEGAEVEEGSTAEDGDTDEDGAVWRGDALDAADLDGDGRPEVLWLTPSLRGRGVLRVVRVR
jgi:hypothetical protein